MKIPFLNLEILKSNLKENPQKPKGFAFDDNISTFLNGQNGLRKPSDISFTTLRRLAQTVPIAAVCKQTLKHEISKIKWDLIPIDKEKIDNAHYNEVSTLLRKPNRNMQSFRTLLELVTEDILDLDAGVIEKVRNGYGKICELYARDGATIKPVYDKNGIAGNPAYLQFIDDNQNAVASWSNEDMIYMMQNPQGSVGTFGYGLSPIESVAMTATSLLLAERFNSTYFNQTSIPVGIINLGPQVPPEELQKFRLSWMSMLQGPSSQWKTPIISSENFKFEEIRKSNQDMQFMEYYMWLARIVVAAYEMSPQDIGLTFDINKSTADSQMEISANKGLRSLLNLWREYINSEIISDFGYDEEFTFEWIGIDNLDAEKQASIDVMYVSNGIKSGNEIRVKLGDDPIKGLEKPFVMTKSGPIYFDSTPLSEIDESELNNLRIVADNPEAIPERELENEEDQSDETATGTAPTSPTTETTQDNNSSKKKV